MRGTGRPPPRFEVPEGTTADAIFLQIANTGESDGAYDGIALELRPSRGRRRGAGRDAAGGGDDRPESGCSAATGARSNRSFGGELAGIAVALGLLLQGARALARGRNKTRRPR